jgi:flagellar hook-associated protein 3 FlgL
MSIGTLYGSSLIGGLSDAIGRLNTRQAVLQGQVASGVASDSYAGLGATAGVALSLQPQITAAAAWSSNVTNAQTTLGVTQTALGQIQAIATNLQTSLVTLSSSASSQTIATTAAQARSALDQLGMLLNTRSGDSYVFGGTASDTPPVAISGRLSTSAFFSEVAASVASVGTSGAAAVEAATVSLAGSNAAGTTVFSSALSVPADQAGALQRSVVTGPGERMAVGVVATAGTGAVGTSTGSVLRDLMRSLAAVGSLDEADSGSAGYADLVSSLSSDMASVSSGLTAMTAGVGATQQQLSDKAAGLQTLNSALNAQLGTAKDVDIPTVSAQLTATTTALQESYSLLADMKGLTLAAFL